MDTPQPPTKSCPPGLGVVAILMGLGIVTFGIFGSASQFQNGRWLPILVGSMFTLAGVQILRVSTFHQAVDGVGTSVIATCIYLAFSAVFFWGAFGHAVIKDNDGQPEKDQWVGHLVLLILAIATAIGAILFIRKLIGQLKNRQ